jgi:hypothetical protein
MSINKSKCINYKFCKGTSYIELEENTCLLCGTWYTYSEGWGKLEFIEDPALECTVCYKVGIQMKFPTNCGHSFCIQCCRNLLYFQNEIYNICPIQYGCSPCKHFNIENNINSCKKRPCCDEDEILLNTWEDKDYDNFMRWIHDEFNCINEDTDELITKKCPLCRKIYQKQ